jgi:hypothetical protein
MAVIYEGAPDVIYEGAPDVKSAGQDFFDRLRCAPKGRLPVAERVEVAIR